MLLCLHLLSQERMSIRNVNERLALVPKKVLQTFSRVWIDAKLRDDGAMCLSYSSESDIMHYVRLFLSAILNALQLDFEFRAEITITQIRPDLCVLLIGKYLVGVVEVKKPGRNVLEKPTVLGE